MLRLDDPLDFFGAAGASEDIMAQLQAQMPGAPDPFGEMFSDGSSLTSSMPEETFSQDAPDSGFGFREFAADTLDAFSNLNLNPNQNFMGNTWNAITGTAENLGIDLGPIGVLNPNSDFGQNASRLAGWSMKAASNALRGEAGLPEIGGMVKGMFARAFSPTGGAAAIGEAVGGGAAAAEASTLVARGAAAGAARGAIGGVVGIAIGAAIGALLSAVGDNSPDSQFDSGYEYDGEEGF